MNSTKKRKREQTDAKTRILKFVLNSLPVVIPVVRSLLSIYRLYIESTDTIENTLPKKESTLVLEPVQEVVKESTTRKSPREHAMKLREGYNMSPEKKADAIKRGIDVPNGYTLRGINQTA